ncbi:MAG TPA: integrase arm-type DNA-binding domain-containing protein [Terracidiphilus sp.]|nr:integrase arm-type DNA-binding domain-containing protein [Terracidiphilus sp.]
MAGKYQLTDTKIRKHKPCAAPVKLTDGLGLYLHVAPTGGKLWRYAYRFDGKQKLMAFGGYPDVSLEQARERHQEARKLLADGKDPMAERKARREEADANGTTFEDVFKLWFATWKVGKEERHVCQTERRINADVIPAFGSKPIDDVTAADIRAMMLKIYDERKARDIAKRAHQTTGQIFSFAVANGLAKRNPAADFKPHLILPTVKTENFARVDTKELPALLAKMDAYIGTAVTKLALWLLAYTFVRTSELIEAEWCEFDMDNSRWDIPAERMKMDTPHIVPLSRQAVEVLKALKMITGTHKLVFPGDFDKNKPMSNNTILKALERMGYKGVMTGHGWRGIASTVLHENGFEEQHIELQLAHMKRDKVAAAYNHAKYLKQRTDMMQWWGDYIEQQHEKATENAA